MATYQDSQNYAAITVTKGDNNEDNFVRILPSNGKIIKQAEN